MARQFRSSPRPTLLYDGLPTPPAVAERGPARAALGVGDERFVVALVGRVSDWKGQDVLARALAEPPLVANGAIGLIAGDAFPGDESVERRLSDLIARLGIPDRARQLGFREDVGTVLGAADALAVPSTRPEPLGLVAMEAGAAGLPVVASAHGGVTEVVRQGRTGLLVAPGDPGALARALATLADDPAGARRMGAAAKRHVAERFSIDRMLEELQQLYERVAPVRGVAKGGSPPFDR